MNDYRVKTPEQVEISYTLAGLGTRFMALAVDTIIQVLVYVVLFASLVGMLNTTSILSWGQWWQEWYLALLIIIVFIVSFGYFIIFELLMKGRTPGKALVRIRVVRIDGRPADARSILLRNLVRIIDTLPTLYGVGVIAIFASRDSRRLGDLVAGTVVIVQGKKATLQSVMEGGVKPGGGTVLTDEEYATVREYMARKKHLVGKARFELAAKIAEPICRRLNIPQEGRKGPERFLQDLLDGKYDRNP